MRDPKSKLDHIDVCLTQDVEYKKTTGLERYDFVNQAAAELSLESIDIRCEWFGKTLRAPLMIAPMTGGVKQAQLINERLAQAAEQFGLAMGVGSQRLGIEDNARATFFDIRRQAPKAFLFANIGAVQLCKGWGVSEAQRAVDMIQADALFLHLNPIQEACQGGDVNFEGLCGRIAEVVRGVSVPVLVREVGFGLSEAAARKLIDAGVSGLDCAGAGGTSWAKVESLCAKTERRRKMGARFGEWGIPTAESLLNVRRVSSQIPLIATGGLRSGIDVAKCLALGADLGAMARPFLIAAVNDSLEEFVTDTLDELRIAMFGCGVRDLCSLRLGASLLVLR
jgi:isopentenyl-diphosphate Delta-isomerase